MGVEEVASVAGEAGQGFEGVAGGAVEGVAYQGVADGGEVDSDLMRAAGVQAYLKGGRGWGADDDRGYGPGGLAGGAGGPDGAEARVGDEADGGEDVVGVVLGGVLSQGAVDLLDAGGVPVGGELRGGLRGFGEEDDAGGGSAEAVDGVGGGGLGLDEAEEGVVEEAAAGEGGQAAGFVDGEEVGVVEEDGEVQRGVGFEPGRAVPGEGLAGDEGLAAGGGEAVEGDFAVGEVLLPGLGGGVGVEGGQVGEDGLAVVFAADGGGIGVAPVEHGFECRRWRGWLLGW